MSGVRSKEVFSDFAILAQKWSKIANNFFRAGILDHFQAKIAKSENTSLLLTPDICLYRTHPHAQDRSLVCQSDRMTGNCHYMADNSKFLSLFKLNSLCLEEKGKRYVQTFKSNIFQ